MNLLIRLKTILAILVTLACFGLSPVGRAVNPPPDGGYPNGNTAEGADALFNVTTGGANTATGSDALYNNTTGSHNTAIGNFALLENRTGDDNTATGSDALFRNTMGSNNTATGFEALLSNTTGSDNTANGFAALSSNTTGEDNTATGNEALEFNTTGFGNTANGFQALLSNTTGAGNTANGFKALVINTTGFDNTATGAFALGNDTTGALNTANGAFALENNTTGHDNLAEGYSALEHNTTGSSNIAVGSQAGSNLTTGSNNIDIGANVGGVAGEANTIRIGKSGTQRKTFIAGIHGATVASGVGVIVGTTGQLGTVQSSKRFKEAIKPMDKASEAILALKPVTFRYKKELDPDKIPQFGLIAEEVEKVNPELVARDEEGKIMSVRYEAVNAMLLNEFLKEHQTVQELKKQVAELTAGLQKVSAQLELNKLAPQVAEDNE
jgi:hypothetical protein